MKKSMILYFPTLSYIGLSSLSSHLYSIYKTELSRNFNFLEFTFSSILTALMFAMATLILYKLLERFQPSKPQAAVIFAIGFIFLILPFLQIYNSFVNVTSFFPIGCGFVMGISAMHFFQKEEA